MTISRPDIPLAHAALTSPVHSMPSRQSVLMASNPGMTSDNLDFIINYNKIRLLVRSYNNYNFNIDTPHELLQKITILALYFIGRNYPSYYNLTFFFNLMVNIIEYLIKNIDKMKNNIKNYLKERMKEAGYNYNSYITRRHSNRLYLRNEDRGIIKLEVFINDELPKLKKVKKNLKKNLLEIRQYMKKNNASIDFYNNYLKNFIIIAENIHSADIYRTGLVYLFGDDEEDDEDKTQEEKIKVIEDYNNILRSNNNYGDILQRCIISQEFDNYLYNTILRNNLRMDLLDYK